MKKIFGSLFVAGLAVLGLASCSSDSTDDFKVGIITVGDENEGYTKAHMDGIEAARVALGLNTDQIIYKKKVEETNDCAVACKELAEAGCNLIFSNSYGHQTFMVEAAKKNLDIQYVSCTGDFAAISGASNFANAFTNIYEARYVSGAVAGMKIKELVDGNKLSTSNYDKDGKVKVGYVGAYPYAEVVSGYTAFYLGIQSVYENVVMDVKYTSSWFDIDKEAKAANALVNSGCVIIGQHADSTGAPSECEKLLGQGKVCYSVGYNVDMLTVAPNAALTSSTNNWGAYYTEAIKLAMEGKKIPTDWAKGYKDDAVGITALGKSCAANTQAKVDELTNAIKNGTLHVFDCSKFTVDGNNIETAPIDLSFVDFAANKVIYQGETKDAIKIDGSVKYFEESVLRSAPYFALRIDGITELA